MPEPLIRLPDDGVTIPNPVGGEIAFAFRGEETDGRLMALVTIAPPGEGPPLHTHANEDECLVVLDGTMRFRLGDDIEEAPAGSLVFVPRGAIHTWQNVGEAPARMLVLFTPSGMEAFFDRFAASDDAVPAPEAFVQATHGTGMEVVGPPLAVTHPR
jgi:quercetin dioxygenase-like cupin family protein